MPHALILPIAGAVAMVAVGGSLSLSPSAPRNPQPIARQTRTIYVSATDKNGAAITDLQAADFEVKEGGKAVNILQVAPAEIPLRVAPIKARAHFSSGLRISCRNFSDTPSSRSTRSSCSRRRSWIFPTTGAS